MNKDINYFGINMSHLVFDNEDSNGIISNLKLANNSLKYHYLKGIGILNIEVHQ
jgi:hypothetical protein